MSKHQHKKNTQGEHWDEIPPRRTLHAADREKKTRWFYFILLFVFFALVVSLLLWGFSLNWDFDRVRIDERIPFFGKLGQ